jgi:hypothetical protein
LETIVVTVAVKLALLSPAPIFALPGTVTLVLLLDRVTLTALAEAPVKVTVQEEVPGAFTIAGEQLTPPSWAAAARVIVAGWLCPFRLAVTVAVALLLTVPAVAVKVPLLALVAMVMLAGTVSTPVLLDRLTTVVLKAALLRVTVQVEVCAVPNVLGAQLMLDNCAGATRLKLVVCEVLLAVAVRVAV